MQKKKSSIVVYALIILAILVGAYYMSTLIGQSGVTYKYSEIIDVFEKGAVKDFSLDVGSGRLDITIDMDSEYAESIKPSKTVNNVKHIETTIADVRGFIDYIETKTVYSGKITGSTDGSDSAGNAAASDKTPFTYDYIPATDNSWITTLLMLGLPILLAVFLIFFFMKQSNDNGKISRFSKASAKPDTGKKTTFADVAGADEEKEELWEIVEFLKHPERFDSLGAHIPKGVLLMGPPGTGKTLLARAVAGEAGVPFYSISGSDFVEMFVGVGASRVRDLFNTAKKNSPAIIFIDEIDAVGRQRGTGLGGGHDEREQTLNQLLVEMDGFGENQGVIVIAATNRRDVLDPALLRPGRFDRQVVVGYPDVRGREEILKVHARNKPLGFDVDLNKIARTTAGFTGADLENLLNEAALLAARKKRKAITEEDIEAATIKVVAGPEKKSHKISEADKKITAYHEAGHAVVTYFSEYQDKVHEVSIVPRGMAAGYTMHLPEEDRMHMSRRGMIEELQMLLAGRVAEEVALDDVCTGASNDIERATQIARDMVTRYGFSSALGPVLYGQNSGDEVFLGRDFGHQRNYSENIASEIDREVHSLIDDAYEAAKNILLKQRDKLTIVAEYLIEFEKINGEDFEKLMKGELTQEAKRASEAERKAKAEAEEKAKSQKEAKKTKEKADKKAQIVSENNEDAVSAEKMDIEIIDKTDDE